MDELGDSIVALLELNDYDLGMKPTDIAKSLGADVDAVEVALEALQSAGRVHPSSFGNWDHGPVRTVTTTDVDQA